MYSDVPTASAKTDIWSLGCILWELVAGKTPYFNNVCSKTCMNINKNKIIYPLPDNCSQKLRPAIEACF